MSSGFDERQRTDYETVGWARLRGVVDRQRLSVLEQLYDVTIRPHLQRQPGQREVLQYPGACRQNPVLLTELRQLIGPLASEVLNCTHVQLLQDAFVHKAAGCAGSIPWHQDYSYTGYLSPPATISLRIALSEETPRSGCMRVLEGSHRWPMENPLDIGAMTMDASAIDFLPRDVAQSLDEHCAWVDLKAGDVSIHQCKTLHGSLQNTTDAARKTIVCHVFDGDCVLDASRLPDPALAQHFDVDSHGHLSTKSFPLLFGQ